MNKYNNIEELFKSELSHLEADPGSGAWNAIQAKVAAQQATVITSATVSTATVSIGKVILITSLISASVGIGLGYFYSNQQKEKPESTLSAEEKVNVKLPEEATIIAEPTEINNTIEESTVIYTPKENNSSERVKVTLKSNEGSSSIVNRWLTPSDKKDKLLSSKNNSNENSVTDLTENKVNSKAVEKVNAEVKEEPVNSNYPVAGIRADKAGGMAPLKVNFSNFEETDVYEWNFGDGNTSTKANPDHTFEKAGIYTVTLTVKNKNGKKATDQITVAVKQESSFTIATKVNVLSPNNDNVNDVLSGKEMGIEAVNINAFQIVIYELKSGNIVFESEDMNFIWDGSDKSGKKLPAGTYIYIIRAIGENATVFKDTQSLTISY